MTPSDAAPIAPPHRGLTGWIAVALAGGVLLAVLVLLGLVERFTRQHATHTATAALAQLGWQMRDQLDRGMAYRYEELRALRPGMSAAQARATLERMQQGFPQYAWLGYANREGTVEAATGGLLVGQNVRQQPWFQGGAQGAFVGDLHPAALLEPLLPRRSAPWRLVDIAMPIYGNDGALAGVVGAHLSWEWARELRRSLLAPTAATRQPELFVIDQAGVVLLGPGGSEGRPVGLPHAAQGPRAAEAAMRDWDDGKRYATAVVPTAGYGNYPGLGWVVVVRQAEAIAFADYHALQREMALGGIAVCLLAALCAPVVARRLTQPLVQLTQAVALRLRDGTTAIPLLRHYREVELLSRVLADAAAQIRHHREELTRANTGLEQRIEARTEQIRASQEQLQAITDNIPALVADIGPDLCFRFANRAHHDWFGVAPATLIGTPLSALYGEKAVGEWAPHLARVLRGERVQYEHCMQRDGRLRHSSVTYLPHHNADGQIDGFHALIFDVTSHKELEQRLHAEAMHDPLTGLPNRRHVLEHLPTALLRSDRMGHHLALLFLDLNGFKKVNDAHGHEAGDQLLRQVGPRLRAAVRSSDTVVRLAGDEFVVLLEPVADAGGDPARVMAKIQAAIRAPFRLEAVTGEVLVSVSIGSAVYAPGCGRTAVELLSRADTAMYAAKRRA